MNSKVLKIVMGIVICLTVILSVANFSLALTPGEITGTAVDDGSITSIAGTVIGTLQIIGVVIAVIILIVIGLKYMTGSIEEKAEYKKTMIPYVVGAILIFAASALANLIYDFATQIGSSI